MMKSMRSRFGCIALAAALTIGGAVASDARATLIAYWNFNDVSNLPTSLLTVSQGAGTLDVSEFSSTTNFAGTTINAISPDPAGQSLALQGGTGQVNNTKSIVFAISTVGKTGLAMTFATQRTGTGFNNNTVSYSSNGGTSYSGAGIAGSPYNPPTAFGLQQFDFSGIVVLNNNANVRIKITFDGSTSSAGNNRLDNVQFFDGGLPTGACCDVSLNCSLQTQPGCAAASGTYRGNGTTCTPNPCKGACCMPNNSCDPNKTRTTCIAAGGNYMGDGSSCTPNPCPPNFTGIVINEVRIEQSGADVDEFFEIYNGDSVAHSLNGLTYIVIGDDVNTPQPANSGIIEEAVDLSGLTVPSHGFVFVAETPIFGRTPDRQVPLNFEDDDNLTHALVYGFTGNIGDDLDTAGTDCVLETTPWAQVIDSIAFVLDPSVPPVVTECYYQLSPGAAIGPDGGFVPSRLYRDPNGSSNWVMGVFDATADNDTPGQSNSTAVTGACCYTNVQNQGTCDLKTYDDCVFNFGGVYKGRDVACTGACSGACCDNVGGCLVKNIADCTSPSTFQGYAVACVAGTCTCINIGQAKALASGTGVRLCNVILSSDTDLVNGATSKSFEIQDATGALTVFGTADQIDALLNLASEGDSIDIQGTLNSFNGLLELVNNDAVKQLAIYNNHGFVGVPAAATVTTTDFQDQSGTAEGLESKIVRLDCVVFRESGTFGGNPLAPTNYTVTDGTKIVTVRFASIDLSMAAQPIPSGPVSITGILSQSDTHTPTTDPRDRGYQLLPRSGVGAGTDIVETPAGCGPPGACCMSGPSGPFCRTDLTSGFCTALGGDFRGGTCNPTPPCRDNLDVRINEIRVDEPSTDMNEYFELKGTPNTPLGNLTYLVIGDGAAAAGSGVIEAVIPLTYGKIPADGYFLAAESTYNITPFADVNLVVPATGTNSMNFEQDDNVTHLLVKNFTGTNGQDLDTDDDGVLDITPWDAILDEVALVKEPNPPTTTEYYYGTATVGPAGSTNPGHVLRCPPSNQWVIGSFDSGTVASGLGNDSPGFNNPNVCPCACPGDRNGDLKVNGKDIQKFVTSLIAGTDPCDDINQDGVLDAQDVPPYVNLILQGTSCFGTYATGVRVVTYNLLAYGGGASTARKTAFKQVMNAVLPDVLVACEVDSTAGANDFLNNVLDAADGPTGYAMATYDAAGQNALYYRTAKITYAGDPDHVSLATTPRTTDRWKLGVVGGNLAYNFYVYGAHLKAGTVADDPSNPATRDAAAVIIRADADALAAGSQIIVAGDLNLYNANINDPGGGNPPDTAWDKLTGGGATLGKVADPIGMPGIWHSNATFAAIDTQSPHLNNNTVVSPAPPGAIGGGMDDRFDFLLLNSNLMDAAGLSYLPGTYKAFGNDGLHFNNDINDAPVGPYADALHSAADHIPVVLELKQN